MNRLRCQDREQLVITNPDGLIMRFVRRMIKQDVQRASVNMNVVMLTLNLVEQYRLGIRS
jgi:hypothetical protein